MEARILTHLYRAGRLTRSELHEATGVRPNTIGKTAKDMIRKGLIREGELEVLGPGRPRTPLLLNDHRWRVIGLGLAPHRVSVCRLTLRGERAGRVLSQHTDGHRDLLEQAHRLLNQACDERVLAVGMSVPGFADPDRGALLLSSAAPGQRSVDLTSLYEAVGQSPVVLENDMHAVAARWSLTHHLDADEDVLLISLQDGAIGAAMLIDGKPNRGCVVGGNELGHMRFAVETDRCHCGHTGCLARIFSTEFLRRHGAGTDDTLGHRAADYDGTDPATTTVLRHLATGLGNIINFVRPNRVVLISEMIAHPIFSRALRDLTRAALMPDIAPRVRFESWDQPLTGAAENAGWLALTAIYNQEWRSQSSADRADRADSAAPFLPQRRDNSPGDPNGHPAAGERSDASLAAR